MKKFILTSLFLALFFCNAYSADEGSIFTYFVTNPDGQYETLFLTYDRNVELDGKNYQQYIGSYCDRTYADSLVLLRREGKKYFCHDTQTSEEHLLFDFGLQKGDTFTDDFSGMVYDVIDVRDSLINDSLHRLIEIRDCEGTGKHDIWLENVGSIYTGILPKNKFQDVCLLIYFHFYYSIEEDVEHSTYFFPNTPQIKTAGMSVTEPQWDKDFKPEEDWDAFLAWLHAPTDLNAEFENGTLHIWGRLRTSCSIQTYAACELNGDKITFMVYPYNNLLDEDCISSYEVETRIPGFERGHYELKLYNKTIELECAGAEEPREYYPEGTKWTEIRLDTLKYDSWYSKIGDEWVPNFETIEYRVQGEYVDERYNDKYSCVYTNGPEWTDSLTLLLYNHRIGNDDVGWCGEVTVAAFENNGQLLWPFCGQLYPLSWEVGTTMSSLDIEIAGTTGVWPWEWDEYGTVEEIKEGDFGGVKPLKYSDVNGIRFIQGIGVASWNDGECIFGPIKPYQLLSDLEVLLENDDYYWNKYPVRHYRSMLVHFERNGEVLYDVWPEKETATAVTYTKGQMATIILPTEPDAEKGWYYKLDKCEDGKIIFEQEKQPQAHIPYIIVPNEDFSIDTSTLDLAGLSPDTVSIAGISFIGSYSREELKEQEGWYIDIIDTTPDCQAEEGKAFTIGALRAYLTVNWDDPINHDGSKGPGDKLEIVLKDNGTSLTPPLSKGEGDEIVNGKWSNGKWFDLQGRKLSGKPAKGVYINDGKKFIAQ